MDKELTERLRKMLNEGLPAKLLGTDIQKIITALEAAEQTIDDLKTTMAGYKSHFNLPTEYDSRMTWQDKYKQAQQRIKKQDQTMLAYESRIKRLDEALAQAIATYKKIEVTMSKYDTVYSIAIPAPEGEGMMDKELIRQQKRWLEICTRDMKAYPWQIWHSERAKLAKDTIAALEAAEQRIAELLNKYEPEPCSPHEWFDGSAVYEMGSRICRKCGVVQKARAKK